MGLRVVWVTQKTRAMSHRRSYCYTTTSVSQQHLPHNNKCPTTKRVCHCNRVAAQDGGRSMWMFRVWGPKVEKVLGFFLLLNSWSFLCREKRFLLVGRRSTNQQKLFSMLIWYSRDHQKNMITRGSYQTRNKWWTVGRRLTDPQQLYQWLHAHQLCIHHIVTSAFLCLVPHLGPVLPQPADKWAIYYTQVVNWNWDCANEGQMVASHFDTYINVIQTPKPFPPTPFEYCTTLHPNKTRPFSQGVLSSNLTQGPRTRHMNTLSRRWD